MEIFSQGLKLKKSFNKLFDVKEGRIEIFDSF